MSEPTKSPVKISRSQRVKASLLAAGGVMTLLLVALGIIMYVSQPVDVRISVSQAQSMLDRQIGKPTSGSLGTSVTPEMLQIDFQYDDRLAINSEMIFQGLGQQGRASGIIRGGIRYDSPYIYLRDMDMSDLNVVLEESTNQRLNDLTTVIGEKLRRGREAINDNEAGEAFDRLVRDGVLALASTVPIYDLREAGLKGSVAALALDGVRFEENVLVLTLSSRAALLRILTFIGLMLLFIAIPLAQWLPQYALNRHFDSGKSNGG